MASPIVNLSELTLSPHAVPERLRDRFAASMAQIGPLVGARKLGARLVEVPAGKRAWPFHAHQVNEEMFVILEGTGELRYGKQVHLIRAGDIIGCPPGGPDCAHQLIAAEDGPLRYLAISTMESDDVMHYPDSGKLGVFVGSAPGGDPRERRVAMFVPEASAVDYWEGEPE